MGRIKAEGLCSVVNSSATIIDAFHTSSILPGYAMGKTEMVEVTDQGAVEQRSLKVLANNRPITVILLLI